MRLCLIVLLVAALWSGPAHADSPSAAARRLVDLTPAAARGKLLVAFTDEARSNWHYTPRTRAGWSSRSMPRSARAS